MFDSTLQRLVEGVPGALGAAVLSFEGLVVAAVDGAGRPVEPDAALSGYGPVLRQLSGAAEAVDLGEVLQFTLESPERSVLVRPLGAHYVAALVVDAGVPTAKGHFYLRIAAPDLQREL